MHPRHPSIRFLMAFLMMITLFNLHCGSESDEGKDWVCYPELLAGGTYTFTVTSVGSFGPFQAQIEAIFNGTQVVLPSYQQVPINPDVTLTMMGITVTADIVQQGNTFALISLNPNPIEVFTLSANIHSIIICPKTETLITAEIDLTVDFQGLGLTGTVTVQGVV